jgi:hypothetical protein
MFELTVAESGAVILVSFVAGVCGGLWGIGAGWAVVPMLVLVGVPTHLAVGCSIVHLVAKSLYPVVRRWKALDWSPEGGGWWIAVPMCVGSAAVVFVGVSLLSLAKARAAAPLMVALCYCVLLAVIVAYGIYDRVVRNESGEGIGSGPARALASFFLGLLTGFLAGLMGIGGGLVRRPVLTYVMGTKERNTGPIAQLTVLVTSLVAIYPHWNDGNIHWGLAGLLCAGGIMGQFMGNHWRQPLLDTPYEDAIQSTYLVAAGALLIAEILKILTFSSTALGLLIIAAAAIAFYSGWMVHRARAAKGSLRLPHAADSTGPGHDAL